MCSELGQQVIPDLTLGINPFVLVFVSYDKFSRAGIISGKNYDFRVLILKFIKLTIL
jgi:hypothetical protein